MFPTVASSNSTGAAGAQPAASTGTADPTVSKTMFLQLLVAQIKNQDPLNPADGVQFLTQLAQFSQLEQSLSMGTDLAAIRASLDKLVPKTQTETKA